MLSLPIKYGGMICGEEELKALGDSIAKSVVTGNWQTAEEAKAMEEESAAFLGVKYGVLCNSGSSAGLLALSALELPKGSEVIIPAVTFPTIFNIILQCNLKPVVVDCEVGTYNMDLNLVESLIGPKTRAIIAVHALGNPVDMPKLMEIAKKNNLYVLEDFCDGFGTTISNKPIGSFGHISFTSFHAAHIVSMGVGGGVYCNDESLAIKVRQYRDWGRQANTNEPHKVKTLPADQNPRFVYDKIGYNFQILELQAAMGRVQLRKSEEIKKKRKANFDYLYLNLLKYTDLDLVKTQPKSEDTDICWFAFPITVKGERAPLLKFLEDRQIETRTLFSGNILRHPAYGKMRFKHSTLKGADYILEHSFWISVNPRLSQEDLEYMVKTFDDYFKTS